MANKNGVTIYLVYPACNEYDTIDANVAGPHRLHTAVSKQVHKLDRLFVHLAC